MRKLTLNEKINARAILRTVVPELSIAHIQTAAQVIHYWRYIGGSPLNMHIVAIKRGIRL